MRLWKCCLTFLTVTAIAGIAVLIYERNIFDSISEWKYFNATDEIIQFSKGLVNGFTALPKVFNDFYQSMYAPVISFRHVCIIFLQKNDSSLRSHNEQIEEKFMYPLELCSKVKEMILRMPCAAMKASKSSTHKHETFCRRFAAPPSIILMDDEFLKLSASSDEPEQKSERSFNFDEAICSSPNEKNMETELKSTDLKSSSESLTREETEKPGIKNDVHTRHPETEFSNSQVLSDFPASESPDKVEGSEEAFTEFQFKQLEAEVINPSTIGETSMHAAKKETEEVKSKASSQDTNIMSSDLLNENEDMPNSDENFHIMSQIASECESNNKEVISSNPPLTNEPRIHSDEKNSKTNEVITESSSIEYGESYENQPISSNDISRMLEKNKEQNEPESYFPFSIFN